ncbi:MAG: DUF2012 domain-containing protein [Myxococcota bacterium]
MRLSMILAVSLCTTTSWAGNITGKLPIADAAEADRTVVYLENVPGAHAPPREPVKLSQKGARFSPPVLTVLKGTRVDMTNDDWVTHNVFSRSKTKTFDLGLYKKGEKIVETFDKVGPVEIFCSLHPRMNGVILVLQNPHFVKPGEDGSFTLKDVPAGSYTLKIYRHGGEEQSVPVKVPASGNVEVAAPTTPGK